MMETRCNILTGISLIYNLFIRHDIQMLTGNEFCIHGILLLEFLFVLVYVYKAGQLKDPSKYRPSVDPNLMCVFLVPLCFLSEVSDSKSDQSDDVYLSVGVTSVIITKYFFLLGREKIPVLVLTTTILVSLLLFSHVSVVVVCTAASFLVWKMLDWIPRVSPKSFSFGEMSICLQLSVVFFVRILREVVMAQEVAQDEHRLKWIGATAVMAIFMATIVAWVLKAFRSIACFLSVYGVFAVFSLVFLSLRFDANLPVWLWKSVQGDCNVMMLLLSWVLCSGITVMWTAIHALQASTTQKKTLSQCSDDARERLVLQDDSSDSELCRRRRNDLNPQEDTRKETSASEAADYQHNASNPGVSVSSNPGVSTNMRKVFHLFILLVYVPGLLIAPHWLFLSSSVAFGVFVVVETVRVFQLPVLGHHLDNILRTFVDERDQGVLFLTHFYLLVGLSLPLWMARSSLSEIPSHVKLYSGVLSLGIGDTVACVAGQSFGRHRWKDTKKTVEGTFSSVLAQLGFVYMLSYLGFLPSYNHVHVLAGVVLAALYEAFTDQIDNLVLPLALFPFL